MSLFKSGESNGSISLRALFDDPAADIDGARSPLSLDELEFAVCRGGWPAALSLKTDASRLALAKDYVANLCESDIPSVDGVQRNPALARAILREMEILSRREIFKNLPGVKRQNPPSDKTLGLI